MICTLMLNDKPIHNIEQQELLDTINSLSAEAIIQGWWIKDQDGKQVLLGPDYKPVSVEALN